MVCDEVISHLKREECQSQVSRYPRAQFKSFKTLLEANRYMGMHEISPMASVRDEIQEIRETIMIKTQEEQKHDNTIHIYTDGSCKGNGKHGAFGGIGVYFGDNDPRNVSEKLSGAIQTNNRAELSAVVKALEIIRQEESHHNKIIIHTDSIYVKNGMDKWLNAWKQNGWVTTSNKPVANQDLWIQLDYLKSDNISFKWVKGHASDKGNSMADKLACDGALLFI